MDVYNAYVNADLEEAIYMRQPPEYIKKGNQYILKLKKAMYRLKRLGWAWYKCLSSAMNKISFTKSKSDAAVFYRHGEKGFVIIVVAVDDLTITAINDNIICEIKADLMKSFKMKDLGKLHWLLNLKIKWDRTYKSISFTQEAYIDKILSQVNLEDSKTHATPIDLNTQLPKDQCSSTNNEKIAMLKIPYREVIGSLMGCHSYMARYYVCSIIIISIPWKSWRITLESCEKSSEVPKMDGELQANSWTKQGWSIRLLWCQLGITGP